MTLSIVRGPSDTSIVNPEEFSREAILNFAEDFRVVSDGPGEMILTHINSPSDQPEVLRVLQRKVANVYNATDVDPSAYLPTKGGTATLFELRDVWAITDSDDATFRNAYPVKCGITITLPDYALATDGDILQFVDRTLQCLHETNDPSAQGIGAIRHGVLGKKDVR